MQKDACITVDGADSILGSTNKYDAHRFTAQQPRGLLHRAFSVFLFSPDGRMLLQQRARSKITFPGVWTNTCCSHPLHGQALSEVDGPEAVASGAVTGAKVLAAPCSHACMAGHLPPQDGLSAHACITLHCIILSALCMLGCVRQDCASADHAHCQVGRAA